MFLRNRLLSYRARKNIAVMCLKLQNEGNVYRMNIRMNTRTSMLWHWTVCHGTFHASAKYTAGLARAYRDLNRPVSSREIAIAYLHLSKFNAVMRSVNAWLFAKQFPKWVNTHVCLSRTSVSRLAAPLPDPPSARHGLKWQLYRKKTHTKHTALWS